MPTFYNPLEVMRLRNDAGVRFSTIGATFGPDVRRNAVGSPKGWDLYAPVGTPAYAVADGIVVWTRDQGDYGKQLLLQFNRDGSSTSSTVKLWLFVRRCGRQQPAAPLIPPPRHRERA
jgi:murein DD-endopeptidase MepM/ murein hydrolase activator NlpD